VVPRLRGLPRAALLPRPEGEGDLGVSARKPLLGVWRDAVCESDLGRTPKLVALVLSTAMKAHGYAWPSQDWIAARASLSDVAVHKATAPLEKSGFLVVERSKGRSSHGYQATLPPTANALRRSEWEAAGGNSERDAPNSERDAPNSERRSPESAESAESGALRAAAAPEGDAADARKFDPAAVAEAADGIARGER
jgi:hypothetical protein